MKYSLRSIGVLAIAALACALMQSIRYFKNWLLDIFSPAVDALKNDRNPTFVRIMQANAFHARIAKRERPLMTCAWRMCPSV